MKAQKVILAVLIVVFAGWLLAHRSNAAEFYATLQRGQIGWLAVAFGLQLLTLWNQPALYYSLYRALGLQIRFGELLPVVWAGRFLDIVTPAAGLGGTALLLEDARRRRLDVGRVALANTLYFLLNFLWFAVLLLCALVLLFVWHDLKPYELAPAGVLLLGLALGIIALIFVNYRPAVFERILNWLCDKINAGARLLLKRELISRAQIGEFVAHFVEALQVLRISKRAMARPVLHAILVDVLEIAVLGACFLAFPISKNAVGAPVSLELLLVGYCIGTLFLVVSITPQGLGVVEGVMAALFVGLGVPLERAAVVVLVFRGLSLWLPLFAGFLALRWTPTLRASSHHN